MDDQQVERMLAGLRVRQVRADLLERLVTEAEPKRLRVPLVWAAGVAAVVGVAGAVGGWSVASLSERGQDTSSFVHTERPAPGTEEFRPRIQGWRVLSITDEDKGDQKGTSS